jgi:hypothetical protein
MGSYGACDIPNEVKPQTAALGFRVKSGWAAVVLLTGSIDSPRLCDNRVVDLCDPQFPETRQPYHAATGKLEMDTKKIKRRKDIVLRVTEESIAKLLADYRRKGYAISRASLVVGSLLDPATIGNSHIRAHAFEGLLFRSVLEHALNGCGVRTAILLERNAYDKATTHLRTPILRVRRTIQDFGRFTGGSWRAEQKLAALAAWLSLGHKFVLEAIEQQ